MKHILTDSLTPYVGKVLSLYLELPETPLRTNLYDQKCAAELQFRSVPLDLIEAAFLLGSLRRLLRPPGALPLSPIRSLAYFQPVIDELLACPLSDNYVGYLRTKMKSFAGKKFTDSYGTQVPRAVFCFCFLVFSSGDAPPGRHGLGCSRVAAGKQHLEFVDLHRSTLRIFHLDGADGMTCGSGRRKEFNKRRLLLRPTRSARDQREPFLQRVVVESQRLSGSVQAVLPSQFHC